VTLPPLLPIVREFIVDVDDREVNEESHPPWRVRFLDEFRVRFSS
jgi:hypothetical protein